MLILLQRRFFGCKAEQFIGHTLDIPLERSESSEIEIPKKNGGTLIAEIMVMEIRWKGKDAYIVSLRDETRKVRLREELREQAMTDDLTSLYNRRGFRLLGEHQLKVSVRRKEEVCLLFVDIDSLKSINDKHGYRKGDAALSKVAIALKKSFRQTDIIARIGGDEFAVLAIAAQRDNVSLFAYRLQTCLDILNVKIGPSSQPSISIGCVSRIPTVDTTIDTLLDRADREMYVQKHKDKP